MGQAPLSWARASGKTGARERLGDDGRTRAPRCLPLAVDDTLTRGLRYVIGAAGRPGSPVTDDPGCGGLAVGSWLLMAGGQPPGR